MIIEIKNIPDGSKIKTVEFKIEFESQQNIKDSNDELYFSALVPKPQVTTEMAAQPPEERNVKPDESVKAPEFVTTTESFPPRENIPEPPKAQISSESVTQPYKEIPKEMLEMEI